MELAANTEVDVERDAESAGEYGTTATLDARPVPEISPNATPAAKIADREPTTNEDRRLVELLGREPTPLEREEYYWETIDDESDDDRRSTRRTPVLLTAVRVASEPAVAVGRATLAICRAGRRRVLRSVDAIETTATRRRQPGRVSDMMLSVVSGVLIAVFVVFPLIKASVRDLVGTIAGSAVRKLGGNVTVSENAPETDGLLFLTEPMTRPNYESSFELTAVGDGTSRPSRDPNPLPNGKPADDEPLDPAATQPTLAPVPADSNALYEAPFQETSTAPGVQAPF